MSKYELILKPENLHYYIKNKFNTNSKCIQKFIETELDIDFIYKLCKLIKLHILKYGTLESIVSPKSITNKHQYFINMATKEAEKSELNHQHGCVIVYKNKIVSCGYNKSTVNYTHFRSTHAEEDAIHNLMKINEFQSKSKRQQCKLYVVRVKDDTKELKMSRPCFNCMKCIKSHHIGTTYYSTNESFIDDLIGQYIALTI